jgi:hypothetical protein
MYDRELALEIITQIYESTETIKKIIIDDLSDLGECHGQKGRISD